MANTTGDTFNIMSDSEGMKTSTTLLKNMKVIKKGEEKESPYRRKRYKVPEYLKAMTEIEKE